VSTFVFSANIFSGNDWLPTEKYPILDEMSVYILWEGATITSVSSPAKSVEVGSLEVSYLGVRLFMASLSMFDREIPDYHGSRRLLPHQESPEAKSKSLPQSLSPPSEVTGIEPNSKKS
jgi:hypothetical protein